MVRMDAVSYEPEPRSAAAPCTGELSKKERWAQENADCVGGLRSPWKAVRRFPQMARAAALVREVLEREFDQDPKLVNVVDLLGQDVAEGGVERKWLSRKVAELEAKLVVALGGATKRKDSRIKGAWNADLVEAFVSRAGDPETDLGCAVPARRAWPRR